MSQSNLALLQKRFWQLISAPEGVAKALPVLSQTDPEIAPLNRWIKGPTPQFSQERLDIYANMYFYRLLDVLRGDFSKVLALIGDARFHNLITDYLLAHPSENPSLRHLGKKLPQFLKTHPLSETWPYLSDLAALEWNRIDIFDREDQTPLQSEALAHIPPEAWGEIVFQPLAALHFQKYAYPVHRLWLALEEKRDLPNMEPQPTFIVCWRPKFLVLHRPVSAPESEALALLLSGAPFSSLCECFMTSEEDIQGAAARAFAALRRWLDEGLLLSFSLPK